MIIFLAKCDFFLITVAWRGSSIYHMTMIHLSSVMMKWRKMETTERMMSWKMRWMSQMTRRRGKRDNKKMHTEETTISSHAGSSKGTDIGTAAKHDIDVQAA